MKWILRLLGLLGVVLLLGGIVAVYLLATFDPNAYKHRIEAWVVEVSGREFTLAGPIELNLLPSLGLRLEDARLANADGFGAEPFAELRSIELAVAALPLLRGEIDVQRIDIDGGTLRLARDSDGRGNWEDLLQRLDATPVNEGLDARLSDLGCNHCPGFSARLTSGAEVRQTAGATVARAQGAGVRSGSPRFALEELSIAGLAVTDLRVEWDDRRAGTRLQVAPANLRVHGFRPGLETPLELDASLRVEPGDADPINADLRLDALLNADFAAARYALRRVRSELDLRHPALEPVVSAQMEADLVLELEQSVARAERLSVHLDDLHLTGLIEVHGVAQEAPSVRAELRSNTFSPRSLLASLGLDAPETTDPDVLTRMALDLLLSGNAQRLDLNPLLLTLDDSSLRGQATVDLRGPRPAVAFDVTGDRLDLDRYLPPEIRQARTAEVPEVPGIPEIPAEDVPIDLPVELMRAFDLDGRMRLGVLHLLGLRLEDIELNLRAQDGDWRLEPLTGTGYQGRLEARASANARESVPRYAAAVDLHSVAIAPLLEALFEQESKLVGNGELALDIQATGASVDALVASLNGQGQLRFSDGAVRGINVASIIRQAEARLRGETPVVEDEPNETDFSELAGSFRIRDGVVQNDDLAANSPLLRVAGRGSIDLPERRMDYRLDTTLVASIEGQGGRSLEDLRGVTLPIRISGSFSEPRFRLDLDDALRERVDQRLRREGEKLQQRLLERLGGGDAPDTSRDAAPGGVEDRSREPPIDRLLRDLGRSLR